MRKKFPGIHADIGFQNFSFTLLGFEDDIIMHICGPQNSTKELLQQISIFSDRQDIRSTQKKSVDFLYRKDKEAKREIREASHFTIATNIKYLGVTLTKEVKDLFDNNFKT